MVMSIDTSILTAYFNAKEGLSADGSGAAGASPAGAAPTNPTPPWSNRSTAAQPSALMQSVLAGGKFIDTDAAKLDVAAGGATANANYRNTFALYQGLSALQALAARMTATNVGSAEKAQIQQAFQTGLAQVQSYLGTSPFNGFKVVQGALMSSDQSTVGAPTQTNTYATGVLHTGAATDEVPAFQGPLQFNLTVTKYSGAQTQVAFDLSEMGSTPRSMPNVVSYLNGKLQAAGVSTRFADQMTPAAPRTVQIGGQSITLPALGDQYALKIVGSSVETLSFSAPAADPAVYVAQSMGAAGASQQRQLAKFDASSAPTATAAANGQVFAQSLGAKAGAVHATATAPDGSVYVLADVVGATDDGKAIKGAQDVALFKYDSADHLTYSRTLGAASSASGLALAVSSDGKQVAIAGSVTGALDAKDGQAAATASDSFVSVYDSEGQSLWSQRTGATGANDQVNAVAFGPDGTVYVAGQTDAALPGAGGSQGGTDAFVQSFHAKAVPLYDGSGGQAWVATPAYVSQYGTSGQDKATGIAVSGGQVYVAGVENGHAVVRAFAAGTGGALSAGTTRDLGDLQGGSVAGIAVAADGSLVVAGSTHNGALAAGTTTQAYAGGKAAFVADIACSLQPAGSDRLTYLGGGADQTASAVTVSGGQVYVAGQIAVAHLPGDGQTTAFDAYVAAVDPLTGQVGWTQRYGGPDRHAAPTSIAVAQGGASVLDRLGLPSGTIDYSASPLVTAATSIRPGDQFFVQSGSSGLTQPVTIAANDTSQPLARKIMQASGFNASASVVTVAGRQQIQIKAAGGTPVQLFAGPGGQTLQLLGLREGAISTTADQASSLIPGDTPQGGGRPTASLKQAYALNLSSALDLKTPADAKAAQAALAYAISEVQNIYRDMTTAPPLPGAGAASGGDVPAYLTNQIANYQAALDRLTGGS